VQRPVVAAPPLIDAPAAPAPFAGGDDVVSVHDAFGIGGDEPLPSAALRPPVPPDRHRRVEEPPEREPPPALFRHNPPF
jgi:hypothetical protein